MTNFESKNIEGDEYSAPEGGMGHPALELLGRLYIETPVDAPPEVRHLAVAYNSGSAFAGLGTETAWVPPTKEGHQS